MTDLHIFIQQLETGAYPDAVTRLVLLLDNPQVRIRAIQALRRLKDVRAVEALVKLLRQTANVTTLQAMQEPERAVLLTELHRTLSVFGKAIVPALIDILQNGETEFVKYEAVRLLAETITRKKTRTDEAVDALLVFLNAYSGYARTMTKQKQIDLFIQSSGQHYDPRVLVIADILQTIAHEPRALDTILDLFSDEGLFNDLIVLVLSYVDEPRVLAFMTARLRDKEPQVRHIAASYLRRYGSMEQQTLLKKTIQNDWMLNMLDTMHGLN